MREIFTSGTVGGALGNRCFYPEIYISRGAIRSLGTNDELQLRANPQAAAKGSKAWH